MLSEHFCSPEIEKLSKIAVEYGAEGFHICGSGGGGCVFIWDNPDWSNGNPPHLEQNNKKGEGHGQNREPPIPKKKDQMIRACSKAGFTHLKVSLV